MIQLSVKSWYLQSNVKVMTRLRALAREIKAVPAAGQGQLARLAWSWSVGAARVAGLIETQASLEDGEVFLIDTAIMVEIGFNVA
jgi:hypothetical protein